MMQRDPSFIPVLMLNKIANETYSFEYNFG